jgi:hypothetical protein
MRETDDGNNRNRARMPTSPSTERPLPVLSATQHPGQRTIPTQEKRPAMPAATTEINPRQSLTRHRSIDLIVRWSPMSLRPDHSK